MDVFFAATLLVVLAPLIGILGVLVRVCLGSPVLFCQERAGRHGKPFKVVKFRTMTDVRSSSGAMLPDSERLTWLGKVLRGPGLDELPQLWNVLRGEMSLVGPRPLPTIYLERYSPEQARRHEVRPGITGWAQINGRNDLEWPVQFELDVWYVDHRSLRLDATILWRSFRLLFRQGGADTAILRPEFKGTDDVAGTDEAALAGKRPRNLHGKK